MSNTAFPTNVGLAPGSSFVFGQSAPPAPHTTTFGEITCSWEQYPGASGPVIRRVAAVVGEPLLFSVGSSMHATWGLTRMPPKVAGMSKGEATGTLTDARFTAKVRGLFVLELEVSGFVKRIEIAAIDASMLPVLQESDATAVRRRWRSVVNDAGVTQDSILAALAQPFAGGDTFAVLLGKPPGTFNARVYGA